MKIGKALAGVSGLTMALSMAMPAYAQDMEDAQQTEQMELEDEDLREIIVTGSNIRGAPPVGSSILNLSMEDVSAAGVSSAAQLLLQAPQVTNYGFGEGQRNAGGAANASFLTGINLRGIGQDATLTLLDGQRVIAMGTGGFAIDPSAVPTNMIQRMDIVADGASAVYGSDAVAGVVNIIMRRGVEGVEVFGKYGFADEYSDQQASITAGHSWSTGQITVGYEYNRHSNLNGMDRDFFTDNQPALGGEANLPITCSPGTLQIQSSPFAPATYYAIPDGGVTQATADQLVPGTRNRCDINKTGDLLPEVRRHSLGFTVNQSIGDNIELFGSGFYWNRKHSYLEAVKTSAVTVTAASPFFIAPADNPTATRETVNYAFTQIPRSSNTGTSESYNLVYGARAALFRDFELELSGMYGHSNDSSFYDRSINTAAVSAAVLNGTFNPFDPNASVDRTLYNGVFDVDTTKSHQSYIAKVDGPLFAIPGGDVDIAFGGQHQYLKFENLQFLGSPPQTGVYEQIPQRNSKKVDSLFAELLVPIFSPENAIPGFYSLTLNGAVRYDKYTGDVNADTTNPKFGVNWEPIEGLTLRGSYGTSFRAPSSQEIFGTTSNIFILPTIYQGQFLKTAALTGVNLDLQPEKATTYSLGLDLEPTSIPGLRFSANYFNIKYTDRIGGSFTVDLNYEDEYVAAGVVVRNPTEDFLQSLDCSIPNAPGTGTCGVRVVFPGLTPALDDVAVFVDARPRNTAATTMSGLDFQLDYNFDAFGGNMRLGANSVVNLKYKEQDATFFEPIDFLNQLYNPLKFRGRANVMFTKDGFELGGYVTHNGSYKNTVSQPQTTIGSNTIFDAHVAYNFEGPSLLSDLKIALDVANLFDKKPPYAQLPISPPPGNGGGGYDSTVTSPIGRIVAISIAKSF